MNQDQVERDRLLTEIASDVKHILTWTETHEKSDNQRFEDVNKKITWFMKVGVVCAVIIVANGGIGALKVLLSIK